MKRFEWAARSEEGTPAPAWIVRVGFVARTASSSLPGSGADRVRALGQCNSRPCPSGGVIVSPCRAARPPGLVDQCAHRFLL